MVLPEQMSSRGGSLPSSHPGSLGEPVLAHLTHHLTHWGQLGFLRPIVHIMRSFAPLKFSAVLGFYDTAWVTPAIIYV